MAQQLTPNPYLDDDLMQSLADQHVTTPGKDGINDDIDIGKCENIYHVRLC